MSRTAYLILENGVVFEGKSFGAEKETMGELVFTTSMVGYLETLTDPSYYGQVVMQTFPLIGNYGVIHPEFISDAPVLNGYIVREWCQVPSNFRCEGDLDTFLKESNIPGIYGIDTRALTKIIRENGVMNCKFSFSADVTDELLEEIKNYKITDAVKNTTVKEVRKIEVENAKYNVVVMDFGASANVEKELLKRGCNITTVPADTNADDIKAMNPDGIVISNGAGNPADNEKAIEEIKKLCEFNIPTFGVCLGHQLIALSQGAKTESLKYGHRGASQPAKDLSTGRVYITSQNHGYVVTNDSLPQNAKLSFVNSNDGTCEGIDYTDKPVYSVQFIPVTSGGPQDTGYLFDRFIDMMSNNK